MRTVPAKMPDAGWSDDEEDLAGKIYNKPLSTVSADQRPITPMKNRMVYDIAHSTLDFKDGQSKYNLS